VSTENKPASVPDKPGYYWLRFFGEDVAAKVSIRNGVLKASFGDLSAQVITFSNWLGPIPSHAESNSWKEALEAIAAASQERTGVYPDYDLFADKILNIAKNALSAKGEGN
jgi:hypothetical protein